MLRDPSATAPLGPPAGLDDIEQLTGGLRSAGVEVELDVGAVGDVPAVVQSTAFRIVQEALTNVARHAGASSTRVCVRRVPGAVTIDVVDDGTGAGPVAAGAATGNGLRGMRERAGAVGGTLQAAPIDSRGWQVHALLPVDAAGGGGGRT